MKYKITLGFVFSVLIFLTSCSDYDNPAAPDLQQNIEMEALKLPPMKTTKISTETIFSISKTINGSLGGSIPFYFDYLTHSGQTVAVNGLLTIPANAFPGNKNINIIVDNEQAIIDFYPSPTTFLIPVKLNLEYTGLELDENADEFDFYYVDTTNNVYELMNSTAKEIDINIGKLGIVEAVIPHFSRFGWFR